MHHVSGRKGIIGAGAIGVATMRAPGFELNVQAEGVIGIRRVDSRSADQIAVRVGSAEDRNRRRVNVRESARARTEQQEMRVGIRAGEVLQGISVTARSSALRVGQYCDLCDISGVG